MSEVRCAHISSYIYLQEFQATVHARCMPSIHSQSLRLEQMGAFTR
jgi:hypothetical protein